MREAVLVAVAAVVIAGRAQSPTANDPRIAMRLELIRTNHKFPALGGAIVTSHGLVSLAVTGARKAGSDVAVTPDDLWHLGSDTKAMTAVVVAKLVEAHKLTWATTIAGALPSETASAPEEFQSITLLQLLSHRAGLAPNIDWAKANAGPGTPRAHRQAALQTIAATPLESMPGSTYEYSNLGYVVAATMAEAVADRLWEQMIQDVVFTPLGMTSCGFGGLGTPGQIDQPWPHHDDGRALPVNGPAMDNPPVMGPAGTVHCSLADWGKFITDQLAGLNGRDGLLKAATYAAMHAPPFGGNYAFGWLVVDRPWGGGTVFTHSGSNTMNFATVWMAPKRDFAVLAVTNRGGDEAATVCDEIASELILMQTGGGLP